MIKLDVILKVRDFFDELGMSKNERVPTSVKRDVWRILRHYPNQWDIERVIENNKDVFKPLKYKRKKRW